jgi:hypothetical protein
LKRFACICVLLSAPSLWAAERPSPQVTAFVKRYAAHYNVPQELICALIDVESGWNPHAVSSKGAIGLMQLMPATARHFGAFNPYDPEQNIAAGTRYVTVLMHEFDGDLRLVAAAYNAGDIRVSRKQLKYRNSDVVAYVASVRQHYLQRRSFAATLPGGRNEQALRAVSTRYARASHARGGSCHSGPGRHHDDQAGRGHGASSSSRVRIDDPLAGGGYVGGAR